MVEAQEVTSLGRGYYVVLQYSQLLGRDVAVPPHQVMAAITRREGTVFLPPDIVFANRYGFTNANCLRREMQIAGRSRRLTIGGINYDLKHMPPNQWKHAISDYGPDAFIGGKMHDVLHSEFLMFGVFILAYFAVPWVLKYFPLD